MIGLEYYFGKKNNEVVQLVLCWTSFSILFIVLIAGLVELIKTIINKSSRNKLISFCKTPVNINSFKNRYQYIFTDFTFDISMILVGLMSILTENILR